MIFIYEKIGNWSVSKSVGLRFFSVLLLHTISETLLQVVFPDIEAAFYDHSEVQAIMLYVLRHYHFLADVDRSFRKTLRSLAFMPKLDMLTTIDRFYDADHELLQKLFLFEENFPSGDYSDPSIVAVLREVGLRGVEDVEPEDLLESAATIQQLYGSAVGNSSRMKQLVDKSDALLEYLHRHKSRLRAICSGTDKTLATAMADICWVRSLATRPACYPQSVRWHGGSHVFFKPSEMVVRASINLVGSVQPVVAAEIYAEVSMQFGWDQTPALDNIVAHLANVVSSYDPRDKVLFMEMSRSIYTELSAHDSAVVAGLLNRHDILMDWIWHGDGFTRPSRMVVTPPFTDLRPYVYSLPTEMSVFADFFTSFGVPAVCDVLQVSVAVSGFDPITRTSCRPLRIGHTRLTYSYHLNRKDPPQCSHCDCALTVKNVLLDCDYYRATRQRFFNVSTLKELFDTVSARDVLGFIRDVGLYRLI